MSSPVRKIPVTAALGAYLLAVTFALTLVFSAPASEVMVRLSPVVIVPVMLGAAARGAIRAARLPPLLALPVVPLAVAVAMLIGPASGSAPIVSGRVQRIVDDLELARSLIGETVAPVTLAAPWTTLALLALGLVTMVSDVLAHHTRGRVEVLLPGGVLALGVTLLVPRPDSGDAVPAASVVPVTGLVVAAGVLLMIALRADSSADAREAAPPPARRVTRGARRTAGAIALACLTATSAMLLGPSLPGAGAEPVVDLRRQTGTVYRLPSPLVDIRARLVEQSDEEMFRVEADRAAYWRLTALSEFDGTTYRIARTQLSDVLREIPDEAPTERIDQVVTVVAPGGQMVPAAAEPVATDSDELRWIPNSSTLVYSGGDDPGSPLTRAQSFRIESASVQPTESILRATSGDNPPLAALVTSLPADFPAAVTAVAAEVTADARTDYDRARGLQDWFRTEFSYSLDPRPGHGITAIEAFLSSRSGYCEQFAGAYVAMARSLGLGARVAVGFTSGDPVGEGGGGRETYRVLGRHAHAWPEVWFDSVGWVAFEPTPGRSIPGGTDHTGVPESTPGTTDDADTTAPADTLPDPSAEAGLDAAPEIDTERAPPTAEDESAASGDPAPTPGRDNAPGDQAGSGGPPIPLLVIASGGAASMVLVAVRRLRRRRLAAAPVERQVRAAWDMAVRSAADVGVVPDAATTSAQWVLAVGRRVPDATRAATRLGAAIDLVRYGPPGRAAQTGTNAYGASLGRDSLLWARHIDAAVAPHRTPWRRLVRALR